MSPHPLANLEMQKYYQNEPKFNGVYSRSNLPKIKDEAYEVLMSINSLGTHWISLCVNVNNIVNFDSFRFEHIPK